MVVVPVLELARQLGVHLEFDDKGFQAVWHRYVTRQDPGIVQILHGLS